MIAETSIEAYKKILPKVADRCLIILKAMRQMLMPYGDVTDQEIKEFLRKEDPNYVRPRRYDLVNKYKLVGFSSKRECSVTGMTCRAWKVLDSQLPKGLYS